jgi:hypothetical protein
MASKVDNLLAAFEKVLNEPWKGTLSGQERLWFLVYDPAEQRKVELRLGDFETAALKAGKKWASISMKPCFPQWMAGHEYKEEYFADPDALVDQLETEFKAFAVRFLTERLHALDTDDRTLVALRDVSSLFGLVRLSDVLNGAAHAFRGRMLVFFPGEFQNNQFRLLDARDGWSYLARPITA